MHPLESIHGSHGAVDEDLSPLGISTIKTHFRTAHRKIGVIARTRALLRGAHHGLLEGHAVAPERSAGTRTLRAV
jgi:hypothetical protein